MNLAANAFIIFVVIASVVLVIIGIFGFYGAYGIQSTKIMISPPIVNTDEAAVSSTLDMVSEAERRIEMFDDGNPDNESVYNNPKFVDKIREKLNIPGFRMECLFNEHDVSNLELVKQLGQERNLEIWVRPEGAMRPSAAHYKIIDDGKLAHLSHHGHGSPDRKYQTIDFRGENWFRRLYHNRMYLGKYRQKKDAFEELSA